MRLKFENGSTVPLVNVCVMMTVDKPLFSVFVMAVEAGSVAKTMSLNFPKATVIIRGPVDSFFRHGRLVERVKSHDSKFQSMTITELEDYEFQLDGRWI